MLTELGENSASVNVMVVPVEVALVVLVAGVVEDSLVAGVEDAAPSITWASSLGTMIWPESGVLAVDRRLNVIPPAINIKTMIPIMA